MRMAASGEALKTQCLIMCWMEAAAAAAAAQAAVDARRERDYELWHAGLDAGSYTHLTLPTIHSV